MFKTYLTALNIRLCPARAVVCQTVRPEVRYRYMGGTTSRRYLIYRRCPDDHEYSRFAHLRLR